MTVHMKIQLLCAYTLPGIVLGIMIYAKVNISQVNR